MLIFSGNRGNRERCANNGHRMTAAAATAAAAADDDGHCNCLGSLAAGSSEISVTGRPK